MRSGQRHFSFFVLMYFDESGLVLLLWLIVLATVELVFGVFGEELLVKQESVLPVSYRPVILAFCSVPFSLACSSVRS